MAGRFFRGYTIYTPPGTRCGGNWNEPRDVLILTLDNDFLVAGLQDSISGNGLEIAAQFNIHNPLIEQLAFALRTQLEAGPGPGAGEEDDLYAESLANMLAAHLVKRYSRRDQPTCEYRGGLPEHKLRRVIEYVHDNLEGRLLLADIAASVGCSPCHLERLFKPATGVALHKYVMQQRVERAKQLLADTEKPIAEVALDCGFQDQSHFTKVFHRLIRVTPKTYRDLH
jgi:AraC family transcriptional regulator